jgi:TIR domain
MSNEFTHDVFLSHSSKDKATVRALAERLRKDGLKLWFDEWELPVAASRQSAASLSEGQNREQEEGGALPSRRYAEKIEDGLEHSRVLVFCMSANAFGSDWAQLLTGSQLSTNDRPAEPGAPLHSPAARRRPPSKARWPNSFTSTGSRRTASGSTRKSSKPPNRQSNRC